MSDEHTPVEQYPGSNEKRQFYMFFGVLLRKMAKGLGK